MLFLGWPHSFRKGDFFQTLPARHPLCKRQCLWDPSSPKPFFFDLVGCRGDFWRMVKQKIICIVTFWLHEDLKMPRHSLHVRHGQNSVVDILISGPQWHTPWALPCHMRRTNHLAKNVGSTTIFGKLCTWIEFYPSKTGESVIYSSWSPSPIFQWIIEVPSLKFLCKGFIFRLGDDWILEVF